MCAVVRTVIAGVFALRRAPLAIVPFVVEGVVIAALILLGLAPASGASAPGVAAFPMNVFFDIKQSLAASTGWGAFAGLIALSIVGRAAVIAVALWMAEGRPGSFLIPALSALRATAVAVLALFPSAVLAFTGVAVRYAPFMWAAAILGFFPALYLTRAALRLDVGAGEPEGRGVPEGFAYLAYAYLVAALGAAMSILGEITSVAAAAVALCVAPVHGLFLLGWREHLRRGTYPGGGALSFGATVVVVGLLLTGTVYDRVVRDPAPIARVKDRGTLFLLGGVDSTRTEGALTTLDVREIGFSRERAETLSYVGKDKPHRKAETRGDLDIAATAVSEQIAGARPPRFLLGHSQAGLIVDRMLDRGLTPPDRSAVLAPPPGFPPPLRAGAAGKGTVGTDAARGFARALELFGMDPFDLDSDASPIRLEPVVVIDAEVPRLAVWPLGDSVWLDRDWRRPGEINVVAFTDHVGVANNRRALEAVDDFYSGRAVEDDEASWRGALVSMLRYAFEPWQPR